MLRFGWLRCNRCSIDAVLCTAFCSTPSISRRSMVRKYRNTIQNPYTAASASGFLQTTLSKMPRRADLACSSPPLIAGALPIRFFVSRQLAPEAGDRVLHGSSAAQLRLDPVTTPIISTSDPPLRSMKGCNGSRQLLFSLDSGGTATAWVPSGANVNQPIGL